MARKMKGTYCERQLAPAGDFDRRSFRYKKSGTSWLLIGCPQGKWQPRKKRCRVGTRGHKLLVPLGNRARCPAKTRCIKKG